MRDWVNCRSQRIWRVTFCRRHALYRRVSSRCGRIPGVTFLRRLKFLVAVLAVAVLQAGTPVLAYAKMAKEGGLTQEVCTPSGVKKFVVDAAGNAREVQASGEHGDHCALCTSPGATPLSSLMQFHQSARSTGAIRVGQTCFQSGNAVITPPATGPPSRS